MKNNIKISVVIPVYNTSKYLRKCLYSVINQTIKEIEIIIVNDGSTDISLSICEEYAILDKRITIISKPNEGLEKARRTGLEKAKGVYIAHLDSDDWLSLKGLENLYKQAVKFDADILVGKFIRVIDKFGIIRKRSQINSTIDNKLVLQEEFIDKYYKNFFGVNIFPVVMWGRLYKKSFIDSIKVRKLGHNLGEDLNYNIQVFPEAKKIFFTNEYVYFYRYGGMTSKFNEEIIIAAFKMYELKKKMIHKYNYQKAEKFIIYELKNYLRSYVEMLIVFKPFSKEKSFIKIKSFLEHVNYKEVIAFYKENEVNDDFVKAMIQYDVEKMFEIVNKKVNKEKYIRKIKSIASSILN